MLKSILTAFSALLLSSCHPSHPSHSVPRHPISQGISAPFAGFVDHTLLVGGGSNFPDVPAAQGGTKVYYQDIYALTPQSSAASWVKVAQFPHPVAYGAMVETPSGLVCIGGNNAHTSLSTVFLISPKGKGQFAVENLPALPVAIDNACAALLDSTLYVTGGNQSSPSAPSAHGLYAYRLGADSWQLLSHYPGPTRLQPVMGASQGQLYLFGGFQPASPQAPSVVSSSYLVYNLSTGQWSQPHPLPLDADGQPRALVGSSLAVSGSSFLIAGGVNYSIFQSALQQTAGPDYMHHQPEWYRFSKDLLLFNPATADWHVVSQVAGFNRAGGILLHHHDWLYMVCGELKPGIRTDEISVHPYAALDHQPLR